MTQYELSDLAAIAMSNFLTTFTIFMSISTAYIVAAFVAGKRLSNYQVAIVNLCFLIATGTMGILSFLIFQNFVLRIRASQALISTESVSVINFGWVVAALYSVLIVGCLAFMWHTRQSTSK